MYIFLDVCTHFPHFPIAPARNSLGTELVTSFKQDIGMTWNGHQKCAKPRTTHFCSLHCLAGYCLVLFGLDMTHSVDGPFLRIQVIWCCLQF